MRFPSDAGTICSAPGLLESQILRHASSQPRQCGLITVARGLADDLGMRDLVFELRPRSGELARIASALAGQQVAIRGGTLLAVGPRILARIIPSDLDAARRALDTAGVRFEESEILSVLVESRAGELAMLSARLANGGVGVRAIYITGSAGNVLEVAIVPDNIARARRALE
jgi:hypothetical protein